MPSFFFLPGDLGQPLEGMCAFIGSLYPRLTEQSANMDASAAAPNSSSAASAAAGGKKSQKHHTSQDYPNSGGKSGGHHGKKSTQNANTGKKKKQKKLPRELANLLGDDHSMPPMVCSL